MTTTSTAPRRPRLATHLTLGVVAFLLLVQVIMLAFYVERLRERRADEVEDAVAMGQTIGGVVLAFVRDLERTTLAAGLALGDREERLNQGTAGAYLDAIFSEYQSLRALFLTDLEGRVVAAAMGDGIGTDLSSRPYVHALQGGAETVWSGGLVGLESGELTVAHGRVVRGPDGAPRAYLLAAFHPEHLMQRLPVGLPRDASVALIDERGSVLYVSDRPGLPEEQRNVAEAPGVREALAGEIVRFDDTPTPLSPEVRFGALIPVSGTDWVVAFTRPQAPLEQALLSGFLREAGAIAVVMLVGATLMALVTRRLTQPLADLGQTAAAIARGERPTVPDPETYAEVMQLAAGMRAMSAAVIEREDALREALLREQDARVKLESQMEVHVQLNAALRETAAARDRAVADLEQVLRTREEFLAAAAHDLKSPLTLIKGLAQMLHRRSARAGEMERERLDQDLARIDVTTTKMTRLIDELLDIARLQLGGPLALDRRSTDLVALVEQVVAESRPTAAQHDLRVEATPPEITGEWDAGRIERVVSNLVNNAIKYSPEGGEIQVTVTRQSEPSEEWAVLMVRDRGVGIPAAELSQVFERFHRGSNVTGLVSGAGVGLAASRQIVEQHDGTIAVDSQEGVGTTVTVRLPLARSSEPPAVLDEAQSISG